MENELTNISTEPLGMLNGAPIRPCMKSGFCCTTAPCAYGSWNEDKSACKHLSKPNKIGQRGCEKYDWIKANVPNWETYPAFGAGCCMPMFNEMRDTVIKNIKSIKNEK